MSLSINSPNSGTQQRFLQLLAMLQERRNQQMSSGKRIAQAADDSAGLAIAKRLEAVVRGSEQGQRNVADGQSLVRTADGALQSSHDAIGRMRELSIQAQNGTLGATDRELIQAEYDQLSAQLNQTATSSNFAGKPLLDGSLSGAGAAVIHDGAGGDTRIELGDASATALGVEGLDVANPDTLTALDNAQSLLSSERARLGALDNSMTSQQAQLATSRVNAEEARSRIEDLDIAKAVAESTRNRILQGLTIQGLRLSDMSRSKIFNLLS